MSRGFVAATRTDGSPAAPRPAAETRADEAVLVAAAGNGDGSAFRLLMERHLGSIVSVARRMLRDDAEAEDVAQEAFLRLWRSSATLGNRTGRHQALVAPRGFEPLPRSRSRSGPREGR